MPHKNRACARFRIAQLQRWDVLERTPKYRFSRIKREAARRGWEFVIPYSRYLKFLSRPCTYCGKKEPESSGWLDRIDNKRGYHTNNVVAACARCNDLRGTLPIDLFLYYVKKIKNYCDL